MPEPITATVAAYVAIAYVGYRTYKTLTDQPEPPSIPPAPPPASYNSYEYDDEGNVRKGGTQVWDAKTNSYVYTPRDLTVSEKQEIQTKKAIKTKLLDNLNKTPAEWETAADEYAKTFASQMQKTYDEGLDKYTKSQEERLNAQGLFGSKAYADTEADIAKQKSDATVDISEKSALAREGLLENRKNMTLAELNAIETGQKSDSVLALQKQNVASATSAQGTAAMMGAYNANTSNLWNNWQAQYQTNRDKTKMITDTSLGLAFLYGYGTKTPGNPKGP
jgi:hypothetical protein